MDQCKVKIASCREVRYITIIKCDNCEKLIVEIVKNRSGNSNVWRQQVFIEIAKKKY